VGLDFAASLVLGGWLDQMTLRGPFLPRLFYDIDIYAVLYLMWECLETVNKFCGCLDPLKTDRDHVPVEGPH